jgi:hypothetical protein
VSQIINCQKKKNKNRKERRGGGKSKQDSGKKNGGGRGRVNLIQKEVEEGNPSRKAERKIEEGGESQPDPEGSGGGR